MMGGLGGGDKIILLSFRDRCPNSFFFFFLLECEGLCKDLRIVYVGSHDYYSLSEC